MEAPAGRARLGAHTLSVLGVFATPRSVADATALLAGRFSGKRDAIDLLATIMELCRIGALTPHGSVPAFVSDSKHEGFGAIPIHVAMLADRVRTSAWLEAIRRVVRPGDVVVDIGTGTGVLAVQAALAGARRVYAIEASGCGDSARALAASNGVGERVQVLRGWSTALSLPEPASVLVTETLDDDPFGERILESTADATRRLLQPTARIIPARIRVFLALVDVPEAILARYSFTDASLSGWQDLYGMDFSRLREAAGEGFVVGIRRKESSQFRRLSDPVCVADVELGPSMPERVEAFAELCARETGDARAVLSYFEAELAPGLVVSTDPMNLQAATHWFNPTLVFAQQRAVRPGDTLPVKYRYPGVPALELGK